MAGVIKTNVQIGDSTTPTNNFVISADAVDGTMKISRGDYGATTVDIMTVAADGLVTFGNSTGIQSTLVSGTSIKSINSTSLLGSGDIAVKTVNGNSLFGSGDVEVQPTLVSGTSIRTVNGVSLLGSGDVSVGMTVVVVTGTTQTAVTNNHYILTNVAASTLTLPASPASGDTVWVTTTNDLTTNVIARNLQTIMGVAEDVTLDIANSTYRLRFVNSSWRLV